VRKGNGEGSHVAHLDIVHCWLPCQGPASYVKKGEGAVMFSVEQGFQKPQGYMGKGLEGQGQGRECLTPH